VREDETAASPAEEADEFAPHLTPIRIAAE